jgi:sugar phosphate isomerase/epimerase
LSTLRVKELKKLCKDAGIEISGAWEKNNLVIEAQKAIEILKDLPSGDQE